MPRVARTPELGTKKNKWMVVSHPYRKQVGKKERIYINLQCQCGTIRACDVNLFYHHSLSQSCRQCNHRWDRNSVMLEAKSFKSISEFKEAFPGAYSYAKRKNLLEVLKRTLGG